MEASETESTTQSPTFLASFVEDNFPQTRGGGGMF